MIDIVKRLREPPFGTETSERNLMASAADEIDSLRKEVDAWRGQFPVAGFDGNGIVLSG